ncbi:unnamed protein product, partial [marine sediment metagenome]
SFSSVVGYSSVKSNPSNTIITDEYDNPTPIVLVLQLMAKLRNHKNIQNVETEEDVFQIIEGDEELNAIVEKLKSYDCGCKEENIEFEWPFPVLCIFLLPFFNWGIRLYAVFNIEWFWVFMGEIGLIFNCWWAGK